MISDQLLSCSHESLNMYNAQLQFKIEIHNIFAYLYYSFAAMFWFLALTRLLLYSYIAIFSSLIMEKCSYLSKLITYRRITCPYRALER